jgi:hypothetical protein
MSWGRPKYASIRQPSCASRDLRIVSAGCACRADGDDLAVAHLVDVRVHHPGDQGLAGRLASMERPSGCR